MLIQKFFSLVPGEDKNLEHLVNELAQSKKNIRKIQHYGAKERGDDSSMHKDDVNRKLEKLAITPFGSRRNASEKDKWCSFRQRKNNAEKGSPSVSQKNKKTKIDVSKDIKANKCDSPTSAKFDLSSIKENELFQRIFKTVERENIKCKNEKLKSKCEKLKKLKDNVGHQNEHVKSKNVNEGNKDQLTELLSEFRKVLSDKKKTYATLKIRTRSFGKERASFSLYPDNDVECYNMHYSSKGENAKNGSCVPVYEKNEQREKSKEDTKMPRMRPPYQYAQEKIAQRTDRRISRSSSHNQKGCSSSRINQNDLINAERTNTPRQKEHRNEKTHSQCENQSVMGGETPMKGKKLPPVWEERSSSSSSRGDKSPGQYYIRSCSSNISVPSSNNYKTCKNKHSVSKEKDKMCEQVNDAKTVRMDRKDKNGKKKEKKKADKALDNKLYNHKNKRSHTSRYIFRNAYTPPRSASKYKSLHCRLHSIDDPMGGHYSPECDNSYGKKFQLLVVKKKRKKMNMKIFAKTKIEKHMHTTSGGIHTLEVKSPNSRNGCTNSVKEDCHRYSSIGSIKHTRENSDSCKDDRFDQDMVTSCGNELKNQQTNSNEDEENSSHFKENKKSGLSEKDLHKMSHNGKPVYQMHEGEAEVCAPKVEDKAQNTYVDSKRRKSTGESKIQIRHNKIEEERGSFKCAPKRAANLNNSKSEIADLLTHVTGNTTSRSNTISNTPCERPLGGDLDETTEKLNRGSTSIMGHSIVAEIGTDYLWKDSNLVKLNKKGSELPHKGENIEPGKQRKKGKANFICSDVRDDPQSNDQGKKHIVQDILSFYTRHKNKLNFLLQEEYNYLCGLRDYVSKNAQESEGGKKDDSPDGTSTHECCEGNNLLINELVHQINNCISEKNKLHNSCDEGDLSTNQIKKCDCRKGKENFMYQLYKDDADVHQICVQTDKRIKRIEYYLNQSEKKYLGKNNSITKKATAAFSKNSSNDSSSNNSAPSCKDSLVQSKQPDCPFRRAYMTSLRNSGAEMNHMMMRKKNLSWRGSTMTKREPKGASISAAMNKKVLVRKYVSFQKGLCSITHFKYELLYRIKVSKYLLHNWTKLGGHYRASSNYTLRGIKCAAATFSHPCDRSLMRFKGSLCLFNYKPCVHHSKANAFYFCYMLCTKGRSNFHKRIVNGHNRSRDPKYQYAQKIDHGEFSNYLNCTDGYTFGKNNKTYPNAQRHRENKEKKIFTMQTPSCENNFVVTRTNSNFSHNNCTPFCGGESLNCAHSTRSVMKQAINSMSCSGGKYITKKESASFASTNLRWNPESTPEEGATCESSTHRMANSMWATSTSTYVTQTGGKNNPLKNDIPTSSSLNHLNRNLNTANAGHVNPNLLSDKEKREQLYDNTAGRTKYMQSANSIKSLGIKEESTLNGKLMCEPNYPFEKQLTRINHHMRGSQKDNFTLPNENNYLKNSITVEQPSAHFNLSDNCTSGGKHAECLSFPNVGHTAEYTPQREWYINVYENNCDTNDSLGKSKNMYQLNCSYDQMVNSLCTSRGHIAHGNVGKNKICKEQVKYKKKFNVINDEEGQNGKDNVSKLWVENFNEVREHNRDSDTHSRRQDKCQLVSQVGKNIPGEKINVNKSDNTATADGLDKCYIDWLINGDRRSSRNIGAKLKKKKKKANNIPHAEKDKNGNTPIQNAHCFEKEKKKGNSPEKELTQGETHAAQMNHIRSDRKEIGATTWSSRSGQHNVQLSPPFDARHCNNKKENKNMDKYLNFEKRESYNFFDDAVDTFDRVMREENSKPFNTHLGVSKNEIQTKWEELKRRDNNPEEYSNFANSSNGKMEESYFFPSWNEKQNSKKLKYDINEHIDGDTPLNWNPSSSHPQKGIIDAKEYTMQKEDSPRMDKHGKEGNVFMSNDNTVNTEYNERMNNHFNQSRFSDFYNSNNFSQSFNFTENDRAVRGSSNCDSISHNAVNTNKLDQIIEKIKKWNEHISNDVNYIQCLFCDKYLFKVENHHDRDIVNSSINESMNKEKYTCSICKHKIRMLNKYKDGVQNGKHVDTQKGEYFEDKLKDGKKFTLHNAEGEVDFLKTEKFENSLGITCSGSDKFSTSLPTDASLKDASLKDASLKDTSLNSDVPKKGAYHSGRKSECGNAFGDNCSLAANSGIDDHPQFDKCSSENEALSFHNKNLSYPRGFAMFDDAARNGSCASNVNSDLFHFEELRPKSGSDCYSDSDSDSGEAIDDKSTRSSGENPVHTYSLDNGIKI
ncbi:hypothetical protein AK88_02627 [Plasmodium fragile]|uniref:Uncharacterized protein n=1 Tax=Plasmodium fragile TaxID=5857 RepID=A0A0D9QLS5_PLAFR|nr:uncharacterized protein AK88_02627 [Plasmodium fragile]KJP87732.1 hypothetical protein AK88_02627 [Plasmodium fragile]